MADSILHFQDGRMAAMRGDKRDARRHKDWLEGYDQIAKAEIKLMGEAFRGY